MRGEVDTDLMTVTETRHPGGSEARRDTPMDALKPRSGWSRPLARPVAVQGGAELNTLADVRSFLFRRLRNHPVPAPAWQRVTTLLLSAARSNEVYVADLTIALEMAASAETMRQAEPPCSEPTVRDTRPPPRKAAALAEKVLPVVDWTANAPKPPQLIRGSFLSRVLGRSSATKDRKSETS